MGFFGNHEVTIDSSTLRFQIHLIIQQHAADLRHIFTGYLNANKSGSEIVSRLIFYNF